MSYPLAAAVDAIDWTWKKVEKYFSEPEQRKRDYEVEARRYREAYESEMEEATWRAVAKGKRLLRLRFLNGRPGWELRLRELGLSRRTYDNLKALALLAQVNKPLLARLACLGPTKLYRLARLPKEDLKEIDPNDVVEYDGRRVRLKDLSDREIEAYLRKRYPPEKRRPKPTPEAALKLAEGTRTVLQRVAKLGEIPDPACMKPILRVLDDARGCAVRMMKEAS
jgi:hypothetical protein